MRSKNFSYLISRTILYLSIFFMLISFLGIPLIFFPVFFLANASLSFIVISATFILRAINLHRVRKNKAEAIAITLRIKHNVSLASKVSIYTVTASLVLYALIRITTNFSYRKALDKELEPIRQSFEQLAP